MASTAEVYRLQQEDKEIRRIAEDARNDISTHEQLCALRYGQIRDDLSQLKRVVFIAVLLLASLMKSDKIAEIIKVMGVPL